MARMGLWCLAATQVTAIISREIIMPSGRYAIMHKLLDFTGVEFDRLFVDWVSASEGKRFAEVVTKFHQSGQSDGPNSNEWNKKHLEKKLQERWLYDNNG